MSEPNYQEAFEELQQIVTEMEEGQITVDELTDKVARAATLIKICKAKLNAAEQNVQEILSSIESQEVMDDDTSSKGESEEEIEDTDSDPDDEQIDNDNKVEE